MRIPGVRVPQDNRLVVPVFEFEQDGAIRPNPLFHRSWDKLHSRCIEYPFAASRIGNAKEILDVGTAQADANWIAWLESLPVEVYATDFDAMKEPLDHIVFHKADVRNLPFQDSTFDKVLAVSVVEHIGLVQCQARSLEVPRASDEGDLEATRELARVLKPGGQLIMTLPFGVVDGLILGGSARGYTSETITKFQTVFRPLVLDYYEYQYANVVKHFREPAKCRNASREERMFKTSGGVKHVSRTSRPPRCSGLVTWRRIPACDARAEHHEHTDGVICGVWRNE